MSKIGSSCKSSRLLGLVHAEQRSCVRHPSPARETLVRVVKAEDGGLDGEGVWAPAMTGYTPGNESDFERMYLEGSLVQIERA